MTSLIAEIGKISKIREVFKTQTDHSAVKSAFKIKHRGEEPGTKDNEDVSKEDILLLTKKAALLEDENSKLKQELAQSETRAS